MLAWLRDLTSRERRTMLACWGGWTLDGFDQQLYSYVVPTVIALWGMSTGAAGTIGTVTVVTSAFGGWFAGLDQQAKRLPYWKMALTVLFGLYPTVMVLSLFMLPYTQRFGSAVAILLGNAASVSFLEWLGMPVISRFLGPWLHANERDGKVLSLVGGLLIVGALGLMTFMFYLITRTS